MSPTLDWLHAAEKHIRLTLEDLRPKLLETQGNIEHSLKDDKTAVTEMDLLVENSLKKSLEDLDKGVPFCGEETGVNYDQPTFWLVDPIDSTESFLRGLPFATNMVSLVDNNQPILAVIYNFGDGDYFLAIKGQGATKNGHAIHVSDRSLDRAYLTVSSSPHKDPKAFGLPDRLRKDLGVGNCVRMAASGYHNSMVACGALEGHVVFKSNAQAWDITPGALLVSEAGGRVASIGKDYFDFREMSMVAANAETFDAIKAYMDKFAAQ